MLQQLCLFAANSISASECSRGLRKPLIWNLLGTNCSEQVQVDGYWCHLTQGRRLLLDSITLLLISCGMENLLSPYNAYCAEGLSQDLRHIGEWDSEEEFQVQFHCKIFLPMVAFQF